MSHAQHPNLAASTRLLGVADRCDRTLRRVAFVVAVLPLALIAGCLGFVDPQAARPRPSDPSSPPGTPPEPDDPECSERARSSARVVIQRHCARCHGADAEAPTALPNLLDTADAIERGIVVPGDPDASRLVRRVETGQMPPASVAIRPAEEDIQALRTWVSCGAPNLLEDGRDPDDAGRDFVPIDEVLGAIEEDLRGFTRTADRARMRYVILVHEYNRGATDEELDLLRESTSFTINSLSRGALVSRPTAIDRRELIYRLDLDDYDWSAQDWENLVRDYPYAVAYDEDSIEYPADDDARQFAVDSTETAIPFIYADWFIETASQGARYYELLRLPSDLVALRAELGLGPLPDDERIVRAGFAESGVSVSNRVIERQPLPDGRVLWTSYDFLSSAGQRNVFANPTDFAHDGGEMIFSLPNGLQAYYIADAAGTRLDAAPQAIVSDPRMPDRAVIAGLSCMGCHDSTGIIPRADEVRAHVVASTAGGAERDEVLRTYLTDAELSGVMERDGERFRRARDAAGVRDDSREPVVEMALAYQDDVDLRHLASVLFVESARLRASLDADPAAFSRSISGLSDSGFRTAREELEGELPSIICAIGVGQPICTEATLSAPCGCRRR